MIWFAILIAMNLQTSFLTPPFGFALFYLKGVSPPEVRTLDIYKGVIPFIALQVIVLVGVLAFPSWFGLSN
jgi:TRAP-type mannitol/chloroaromatic compound transport system permease large subunit